MCKDSETYLQVSKLGELLATLIKSTEVWFCLFMDVEVSAKVAPLCEGFCALITHKRFFTRVSTFMSLQCELVFV
jgi:hypothetical protein